jgi:hypothetical protein
MPDRRNILRAQKFRERIELYLRGSDLDVTIPPPHRGRDKSEAGDVFGLAGWSVIVRADYAHDWSGELDAARRAAEQDGRPLAAVVGYRTGDRLASEQYVTMTLADFTEILRKAEGVPVS